MMRPAVWLATLVPFATSFPIPSSPASGTKFPWHSTEISDLEVECVRGKKQQPCACNMKFDFYDPNSELVQDVNGAHCDVSWSWDGKTTERGPGNGYPHGFTVCSVAKGNIFQVQISRFHTASNWTIIVSHKYDDDVHFEPPLNMPNSFTQFEFPKLHPDKSEKDELDRFRFAIREKIEAPVVGLA